MSEEMFDALLKIIDAKIVEASHLTDWDGGLRETIMVGQLVDEFKEKFVVREDD